MVLPCIVVDLRVPPCMVASWVVHPCKVASWVVHPCKVDVLIDLLHNMIDLMVPPCIAAEWIFLLRSWGSWNDKENFLADKFLSDWVDPIKDLKLLDMVVPGYRPMVVGMEGLVRLDFPGFFMLHPHRNFPHG
jgi:hypothetical protein